MNAPSHPRLAILDPIGMALDAAATASARSLKKAATRRRRRQGETLHPGVDTPLWNELVIACSPHLKTYGAKARLGRELGVSRQRIHEMFVARTALPDGERALLLLIWLAKQRVPPAIGGPAC